MQQFIRVVDAFTLWTGRVIALLIIPMIVIVLYTAVQRYFFGVSVDWGFEMALFAYGIHTIMGGAYCLKEGGHVNVDILPQRLPFAGQRICEIAGNLVMLGVMCVIIYYGVIWAYRSTLILERSIHGTIFNPQIWWFKWVVPLSAAMIALQNLAEIAKKILVLTGRGAH